MNVQKTDVFIADVERQFEWYVGNAGWEVAEHYLDAVQATCRLLGQHPRLGPPGGFTHPRLHDWRFLLVLRPFNLRSGSPVEHVQRPSSLSSASASTVG